MSQANVFNCEFSLEGNEPEGYAAGDARVGEQAGGRALTVKLYEIPPANSLCPYHYEYEEEWLLLLEGEATLRTPEGERELERGALVCFPPGPEGAHKVTARGEIPARVLMFSSAREPAVSVYPDSDKIGVWPGRDEDHVMLHRGDGRVDYWAGEET